MGIALEIVLSSGERISSWANDHRMKKLSEFFFRSEHGIFSRDTDHS